MTFQRVAELLAEHKDLKVEEIKEDSTFESFGFDSLDVVELIMVFEQEFGVSLTISQDLKTVGDLVKLIDQTK
ncbi:MAG TPA: acyl carrier protein [Clostridiales bacterium]|jgi:acyl carrier protein|nr:acyl carrier protein [Clostridiales bacterium]